MTRILIIGAGGHAQVIADILLRQREHGGEAVPAGFVDDNTQLCGREYLGIHVIGTVGSLAAHPHDAIIIGIGDNAIRREYFETLIGSGENLLSAIHPSAILARDVQIGRGVVICAGVIVNTGSMIGDNVILNTGCTVDHHSVIGAHAHIAPGAHLAGGVRVGEGALIGIGAAVLPQRHIGEWCVIGAGAAVTHDIPSRVTAAGVPARILQHMPLH